MEMISEHVSLAEAIRSEKATKLKIANTPTTDNIANMKALAEMVFEPLRRGLGGKPIRISSMFRSVKLNANTPGASNTSQHCKGEAMDLVGIICTNAQLFHYIKDHLPFDQLIWEHGTSKNPDWVHVSFSRKHNRAQVLKTVKVGDETKYQPW